MNIYSLAASSLAAISIITLGLCAVGPALGGSTEWLIDDFSRPGSRSAIGTEWRFFADTVMGGISRGRAERDSIGGKPCLRLTGQVSMENGGGFIQVALPVDGPQGPLDAGAWKGIRLLVRATGRDVRGIASDYELHLRTGETRLPWQYYSATFPVTGEWAQVDLPFDAFQPVSLREPLDPTQLTRIGIVAARRAFQADMAVATLSLYR